MPRRWVAIAAAVPPILALAAMLLHLPLQRQLEVVRTQERDLGAELHRLHDVHAEKLRLVRLRKTVARRHSIAAELRRAWHRPRAPLWLGALRGAARIDLLELGDGRLEVTIEAPTAESAGSAAAALAESPDLAEVSLVPLSPGRYLLRASLAPPSAAR